MAATSAYQVSISCNGPCLVCLPFLQVLRVMAMTGAGLEEEGALEAGVAAMSSILGMKGLPREQAPVANLMTGMVKAMGSIACLSEVRCSRHSVPRNTALADFVSALKANSRESYTTV